VTGTSCLFDDCAAAASIVVARAEGQAEQSGTSLNLSSLPDLPVLPAEFATLVDLEYLDISQTNVSDLSLAYAVPLLNEPNIAGTPLSDMRVKAEESLTEAEKYHYVEGVEQEVRIAVEHCQLAYDLYDWGGYAAYQIGFIYDQGDGVREDDRSDAGALPMLKPQHIQH